MTAAPTSRTFRTLPRASGGGGSTEARTGGGAPGLAPAPADAACTHCRLPVPPGLLRPGVEHQFCCHGCETAYSVINACGLANYYRLLDRTDTAAGRAPARTTARRYAEFDDPAFQAIYCRVREGGALETELLLEGVHCAACVWLVEKLPQVVPGVIETRLDLRRATVTVALDPRQTTLARAARTLDSLGYPPHPARGMAAREGRRREDRRMLVRMGVAGACAGNIMLLFFALYAGMFEGLEPQFEQLFRWASLVITGVCLAWPGTVFLRGAWAALRTRTISLDVPIALGLYLGGLWGAAKTVMGTGDLYFDSISALIFFLLVGRYVQQRQQRYAADAVELLFSLTPTVARKVIEQPSPSAPAGPAPTPPLPHSANLPLQTQDVPTEALAVNDLVEVRPGDCIPVDGVVTDGATSVDLSLLTGESRPVAVGVGGHVAAGSVNLSSTVRVRVEAIGESTRIGRLMRMVEEASRRRAAIILLADRWGAWLLWILLGLAALTLTLWWHAGPAVAIDHAAALLIATCPCGLGLATPMAMTVAVGRAARRGLLIKGGDALQSLAAQPRPGHTRPTIVLDKTGTLTRGTLSLVRWTGDESVKPLVAELERHSNHPIALALLRDLSSDGSALVGRLSRASGEGARGLARAESVDPNEGNDASPPSPRITNLSHTLGAGLSATIDGHRITAGTRAHLLALGVTIPQTIAAAADQAALDGLTPVHIAAGDRAVAVAALGDPLRSDAASSIRALEARGYDVRVLSGDHPDLVRRVATQLGLDPAHAHGGVTPEAKLAFVRDLAARPGAAPVVMVGDGVNDAAALAAATVGIAVRGGAEASLAAADVSLSREGLAPILDLVDGARRTMRTIHWTIATSLVYNVVAAGLSIGGLISPLVAAIIMPASSFTVVALCLRSRAFRP